MTNKQRDLYLKYQGNWTFSAQLHVSEYELKSGKQYILFDDRSFSPVANLARDNFHLIAQTQQMLEDINSESL